jgi:hypothetical protein
MNFVLFVAFVVKSFFALSLGTPARWADCRVDFSGRGFSASR